MSASIGKMLYSELEMLVVNVLFIPFCQLSLLSTVSDFICT